MIKSKKYCVIKLCYLIRKTCNGFTGVIREDVIGNLIEAICIMFFIRGDDYSGLPKSLEASNHVHAVLLEELFDITNDRLLDAYVDKLINRGQEKSAVHAKLKAWKD